MIESNTTFISYNQLPLALTVAEAGNVLRIGRSNAYAMVRCGRLRSLRIGRQIRIPREAIAEFLNGTT